MSLKPNDLSQHPVSDVIWVPLDKVRANSWNPNKVAAREMRLLYMSILHDGFTQPVVTMREDETDSWQIVDGFHRWTVMKRHKDIYESTGGLIPIVVIDKSVEHRMASTVRHNRARGKHSVTGMSQIVFGMLDKGMTDVEVCNELGMEADELLRLKHITGFAKLFTNVEYQRAWETRRMITLRHEHEKVEANGQVGDSEDEAAERGS